MAKLRKVGTAKVRKATKATKSDLADSGGVAATNDAYASEFQRLDPPSSLSPERAIVAEKYAYTETRPPIMVRRSYMTETHLGGLLEKVPGFDASRAMTYGLGGQILSSRWRGPQIPSVAEVRTAEARPETRFGTEDAWVRNFDTALVPWRCVCHLEIAYRTGRTAFGTGWFASKDTVVTAGHNVFSSRGDGWARTIRVIPGRDGDYAPYGETYAERMVALPEWISSNGQAQRSDLGAIKVADRAMGLRTGWYGFAVFTDENLLATPLINSVGYPAVTKPFATQWYDGGRVVDYTEDFIEYRLDTEEGQSGSPIFYSKPGGQRWVVATHTYGLETGNRGARITEKAYNFLSRWCDAS